MRGPWEGILPGFSTQWLLCAAAGTLQIVLGISASHSARPVEGKEGRPLRLLRGPKSQSGLPGSGHSCFGSLFGVIAFTEKQVPPQCSSPLTFLLP